jgi:hypothetical protein
MEATSSYTVEVTLPSNSLRIIFTPFFILTTAYKA